MERLGRHDQLPAQLQHRRGRGRRQHDLPQDRVPRAPQPLRVLSRERARSRASTPIARASSACTTASASRRRWRRASRRTRSPAAGRRSRRTASTVELAARRDEDVRVRARLRREPGRREVGEAGRHQQAAAPSADRRVLDAGAGRRPRSPTLREHWNELLGATRSSRRTRSSTGWSTSGIRTSAW